MTDPARLDLLLAQARAQADRAQRERYALRRAMADAVRRLRSTDLVEGCMAADEPCMGLNPEMIAKIADDLEHAMREE